MSRSIRLITCPRAMVRPISPTTFFKKTATSVTRRSLLHVLQRRCSSGGPLYPYSGSLPSPGYEWCKRCNIPSRHLQKAIGEHNPCLDRPTATFRFLGLHICAPARQYYREQLTTMAMLMALCFVALPARTTIGLQRDFDDDH